MVEYRKYTLDELKAAVASALCWKDVYRTLGICQSRRVTGPLKRRVIEHNISTTHFNARAAMGRKRESYTKTPKNWTAQQLDVLRQSVLVSCNWSELCTKTGRTVCTFNINRLRAACVEHNIDVSHFNPKLKQVRRIKWTTETFYVKGCTAPRPNMRTIHIRLSGGPTKCDVCGIPPTWNGTPLVIELDHINGDCQDNRMENLRWLCPNCHSQTASYRRGMVENTE